jgi:hypothetical protein
MTDRPPLDDILERAVRAPSVHNTQPWRWRVNGTQVDLLADYSRQLVYADPARRDLMISCGAALHHFQVAAAGLGWATRVRRLPDASEERHIASIHLSPSRASQEAADLLRALDARRTDRRRPTSWPVPSDRLNGLASVGTSRGAQVLPVDGDAAKARLQRLTSRARRIQGRSPRYLAELASWTHCTGKQGVPASHVPTHTPAELPAAPYSRFPSGDLHERCSNPSLRRTPCCSSARPRMTSSPACGPGRP